MNEIYIFEGLFAGFVCGICSLMLVEFCFAFVSRILRKIIYWRFLNLTISFIVSGVLSGFFLIAPIIVAINYIANQKIPFIKFGWLIGILLGAIVKKHYFNKKRSFEFDDKGW